MSLIPVILAIRSTAPSPVGKYISNQAQLDALVIEESDKIYFAKGGTFNAVTLTSDKSNVSISSFGSGAQPILKGSKTISGSWVDEGGGVYSKELSEAPKWMYINGAVMPVAKTTFQPILARPASNQLTGSSTYLDAFTDLVGKKLRTFEYNFRMSFEYTITAYSGGVITVDRNIIGSSTADFFFIYNYTEFLETNTWCNTGTTVYVKMSTNPSLSVMEYGYSDDVINFTGDNCTISGLDIRHSQKAAIRGYQKNISISNCTIQHHRGNGVYVWGNGATANVNACTIHDIGMNAIRIGAVNSGAIAGNNIYTIGTGTEIGFPQTDALLSIGYPIDNNHGTTDDNTKVGGNAINLDFDWTETRSYSQNVTVELNTIDDIGYAGIKFIGDDHIIRKNVISNFCKIWVDAMAIGSFEGSAISYPNPSCKRFLVDRNIVKDFTSIDSRYPSFNDPHVLALYADVGSTGTFSNNTVKNMTHERISAAIYLYQSQDVKWIDNVVDSVSSDIVWAHTGGEVDQMTGNIFINRTNADDFYQIPSSAFFTTSNVGTNYYVCPFKAGSFVINGTSYNFTNWKAALSKDTTSIIYENYDTLPGDVDDILVLTNETETAISDSVTGYTDKDKVSVTDYTIQPFESLVLFRNLP